MFKLMDNIEKALKCDQVTVIDKSGKFHRGQLYDHYVRYSGGKLRGKVRIRLSDSDGEIEVDANDILDIRFE